MIEVNIKSEQKSPPTISGTCFVCSRLVPLLEVIKAPIQVPDIVGLAGSFKYLAFSCQICFHLFLKCLLASRFTLFRLSTMRRLGSCIHCILACFLRSKKSKQSLSNHGLCCFNSCRPRLSLPEVLIFSLCFPKPYLRPRQHLSSPKLQPLSNINQILFLNLQHI